MRIKEKFAKISQIKNEMQNDNVGIAPIVWAILIAGTLIAGIGVYQVTQRPDITYNITDTGFSLAGVDVSFFAVIGIVILIIFGIMLYFRKK